MTGTEVKKQIKKIIRECGGSITKTSVTVGEYEGEFDINANFWYSDKYHNPEFDCITMDTFEDEETAEKKAKRLATTLANNGLKATYNGIENC